MHPPAPSGSLSGSPALQLVCSQSVLRCCRFALRLFTLLHYSWVSLGQMIRSAAAAAMPADLRNRPDANSRRIT